MQASKLELASPGGLLVLTGASHTGKTSVAEAAARLGVPPIALLGVDSVIRRTLVRPRGDLWREGIPLAYEILAKELPIRLNESWLVVLESTFTYVPDEGRPQLHLDRLAGFVALATAQGRPATVAQLNAPREVVLERARRSGRLPPAVVEKTLELHDTADLPAGAIRVETEEKAPEEIASGLLGRVSAA